MALSKFFAETALASSQFMQAFDLFYDSTLFPAFPLTEGIWEEQSESNGELWEVKFAVGYGDIAKMQV